ncbi:S1C family serine protease [Cryobacterium cryoconiti]|uniref:PDZ domain-containing protein n=1 Tax=Cryobacterium cryoconiti TaxID=1259239 RepID=A0A4Y8JU42_9MICO|nr:trypsin-like peptidase domain-containing protein [Cryobacterium cryoconiti]TFD29044.1 PDZ domain-containing protein [Cryobacterium cryoconiti]
MTDNTPETGSSPDSDKDAVPFEVNAAGEANAPVQPTSVNSSPSTPTAPTPADEQATEVIAPDSLPTGAQPAPAQPAAAQQPASATHPTQSYATDAFGRPIQGAPSPSTQNAYAPTAAPQAYAQQNGQTGYPADQAGAARKAPRRSGNVALIAALAIGALVGGASGAGVTAFMLTSQSSGIPVSEASGPSSVVVNNTDSVNQITAVAAKATPSVVTISASSDGSGGTGSGVILSEDGYILTNTHVVTLDGAASDAALQVTGSDGKLYTATLVGTDPISDLAVIKLDDVSGLTPIKWADSSKLNVGDTAIAIGAPLGLSGSVTDGIVSALNRSISIASSAAPSTPDRTEPDDQSPFFFDLPDQNGGQAQAPSTGSISLSVIQTDAAINPGNSGGALLNSKGELIGINVAIASAGGDSAAAGSIGVGFSIPSNLAKRISDELIATGSASHGLLGASVTSAAGSEGSTTVGALISEVSQGGAADKGGLKAGDIVTNLNDVPITDANDLTAQVRALAAGEKADVTYVRDGKSVTVSVTLGELTS